MLSVIAAVTAVTPAIAQGPWTAVSVATSQPVTALRQVGGDVFVEAGAWFRATVCGETICLERDRPPNLPNARGTIPDGAAAIVGGAGVNQAWYANATDRYDHGILGDRIEGGSLVAIDDGGRRYEIVLGPDQVFEDQTPRIADIDGDGRNDVVTIRSGIATGAGIAVYSIVGGALKEIAAIPPIGQTHRWLNVAGLADLDGDGRLDIALVKTPHIGGTLELWTMSGGGLVRLAAAGGFSNHAIYSTELGMSAVADFNSDGTLDLALPNDGRTALRIVTLAAGAIAEIASVPLGQPIMTAIGVVAGGMRPTLLLGLADGTLVTIR